MWQVKEKSNMVQRLVGMQWMQFVHSLEIWTGGLDACGHPPSNKLFQWHGILI